MQRIAVLVASLALFAAVAHGEEMLVEGIAAQVGSEIVLVSDVMLVSAPNEAQAAQQGATANELLGIRSQILERMIERALIRQVVKKAELSVSDAEVDQAIAGIAQENQITLDQVKQSVEQGGMPWALYRERIRSEIEHSKVMNGMVASKVRVTDEEVRRLYDDEMSSQPTGGREYHLRLVVVSGDDAEGAPRTRAAACEAVSAARDRILAGEDFRAVASQVTESNPQAGGELGWIHEGDVAAWMRPALGGLASGGTSSVIETDFGCGLIQLVDQRDFQPRTYEQARDALYARLFNERLAVEYAKFIEELRSRTFIERKGMFADVQPGASTGAAPEG
jgi:peptidyl-prolyl cis-trans isomerase SurA